MKIIAKYRLIIVLTCLCALTGNAQTFDWNVSAKGFFDNSEGDDSYRSTMTHSGIRLLPEVSVYSENKVHSITAGYDAYVQFGDVKGYKDGSFICYYGYQSPHLNFYFGSVPRREIFDVPDYILCDSIKYYRPNILGFAFQYHNDEGEMNFFVDWTSVRSKEKREQFMAGATGKFLLVKHLQLGIDGYYYHYALETDGLEMGHHIHDNLVIHPYVGISYSKFWFLDSLDVRGGILTNYDRDRGDNKWHTPTGFVGEVSAKYKRMYLRETIYSGGHQQQFGNQGFGEYYWGDTYVQASIYSRTDLRYEIFRDKNISVNTGIILNNTPQGLNWHQMLTINACINGKHRNKTAYDFDWY